VKEGIVHRDIKPENIIVRSTAAPDVVMVDFGLSFNEDADQTNTSVDEGLDNKFISLPERRGPGENKRDPRSDITDVCAILFYCLTGCSPRNPRDSQGRPPHRRPNYELTGRVQNAVQLTLLNGLLDRGLNYELDARFQTVEELVGRLNEVANPAVKPVPEDLDAVASRESAALRKNDRKTQLSNYSTNAQSI
jgi:serine/threonine protein kinase